MMCPFHLFRWFDTCPNCHKTNDTRSPGFWRQWEAFDCPDLDSIHNDGERHIPYIMFWPSTYHPPYHPPHPTIVPPTVTYIMV